MIDNKNYSTARACLTFFAHVMYESPVIATMTKMYLLKKRRMASMIASMMRAMIDKINNTKLREFPKRNI